MSARYVALPFAPTLDRAAIVSHMMRSICAFETVFSDYTRACEERCFECERCLRALAAASGLLADPRALIFEVWDTSDDEQTVPIGIVLFLETIPQIELEGHYAFFDGRLRDKTELLEQIIESLFAERTGWAPPQRISIQVPDYAFALARHAHKYLGFGGEFVYQNSKNQSVPVEGVRKRVIRWCGAWRDVLMMARERARGEL